MFRCQLCGKQQESGVPVKDLIVEKRPMTYKNTLYNEETEKPYIKHSEGWEIVKEKKVCQPCFEQHNVPTV